MKVVRNMLKKTHEIDGKEKQFVILKYEGGEKYVEKTHEIDGQRKTVSDIKI